MSVLVDTSTRLLVQGLGGAGKFHVDRSIAYGTQVVAATHPTRAGEVEVFEGEVDPSGVPGRSGSYRAEVPIFATVRDAVRATGANASVVFVPPPFAADAIMEAADAGVPLVVVITEGIPIQDMVRVKRYLEGRGTRLVGPNCPGVITPHQCRIGIMPGYIHAAGRIGVVSRSGTLTYEAVKQLSDNGLGQTTAVGIGGDPVHGTDFVDVLRLFEDDPVTEGVLMIGEIGGSAEEEAAAWMREHVTTRGGVHRRHHGPAGEAHGARRRHHLGREGHRRGQDRGARGGRGGRGRDPVGHGRRHARGDASGRAPLSPVSAGAGRGRFAPSPTGDLHLGNARTALLAWARARASQHAFVLRIEDLDGPRTVAHAVGGNVRELRWLGLDWDEGPDVGGPTGPYRQSERGERYQAALARLQAAGRVAECFLSRRDLVGVASRRTGRRALSTERGRALRTPRSPPPAGPRGAGPACASGPAARSRSRTSCTAGSSSTSSGRSATWWSVAPTGSGRTPWQWSSTTPRWA
jgi:succinyl-CoA synthetase alpha subunit